MNIDNENIHNWHCENCGLKFEKISEGAEGSTEPSTTCPKCGEQTSQFDVLLEATRLHLREERLRQTRWDNRIQEQNYMEWALVFVVGFVLMMLFYLFSNN